MRFNRRRGFRLTCVDFFRRYGVHRFAPDRRVEPCGLRLGQGRAKLRQGRSALSDRGQRTTGLDFQGIQNQVPAPRWGIRSEEHTSELQSLMRISYAVFCLKKKK